MITLKNLEKLQKLDAAEYDKLIGQGIDANKFLLEAFYLFNKGLSRPLTKTEIKKLKIMFDLYGAFCKHEGSSNSYC